MKDSGAAPEIDGGQTIEGGSASITVTLNVQLDEPQLLRALHVTVVGPIGNVLPEAGVHVTVGEVPLALGVEKVTTAEHWPGSLLCEIGNGQAPIVGAVITVIAIVLDVAVVGDAQVAFEVSTH
jgi:hypothetical protein